MDTRAEWDWLAGIYFPVMIAVTLVVVAAFVYPVLRYRSRGRAPSQHSEAPRLEWALGVVLLCTAVTLAVQLVSEGASPSPSRRRPRPSRSCRRPRTRWRSTSPARRWRWRFDHPDAGVTTVGGEPADVVQLVVPRGRPVRLRITPLDVVHSLFLIDQRYKRDAVPGRGQRGVPALHRAGRSAGHCAEFCGTYHADMNVQVIVLEPEAFARWATGGGGML